jgi:hypothetical protein
VRLEDASGATQAVLDWRKRSMELRWAGFTPHQELLTAACQRSTHHFVNFVVLVKQLCGNGQ